MIENLEKDLEDINSLNELMEIRVKYLGKNGKITMMLKELSSFSDEEKKAKGQEINTLKNQVIEKIDDLAKVLKEKELNQKLEKDKIDKSLGEFRIKTANLHPLSRMTRELEDIFRSMNYDVVFGPELELDKFNFQMLNIGIDHPARDAQDTFYVDDERLLRTQTSSVQVRTMLGKEEKTPLKMICPGKVYRRDNDDATHSHQFMQLEGLVIDEDISLADLKGTLEIMLKKLFGDSNRIRFRPSFFPFTEPSVEVDISCFKCGGEGCFLCKNTGWIEVGGSGMVHPNVLRDSGYDPNKYSGFAFGMGIERLAMFKYGINDVRQFYTNDIRFLDNFNRVEGGNK